MRKKARLKDIADLVGVSKTTVSLVLNRGVGHQRISQATRNKIETVASKLDYEVDYLGVSLKRQSTMQIALAVPNIYHPFMPEMIRGVEETLREKGYHVLLLNFTNQDSDFVSSSINRLRNGVVDGLISFSMGDLINGETYENMPIVHIDENDYRPAVRFDGQGAGRQLTQHFIDQGLEKIAFIGANSKKLTYTDRQTGHRKAMEEAGLDKWMKLSTNVEVSYKGGQDAFDWISNLSQEDKPEAIVVNTDNVAHALMLRMIKANIRIPQDIAIASIDNIELSKIIIPRLTCIDVPAYEMGARAGDMLLDLLNGKKIEDKVSLVETELIIRESSIKDKNNTATERS